MGSPFFSVRKLPPQPILSPRPALAERLAHLLKTFVLNVLKTLVDSGLPLG
jgi:hypothetical protein